MWRRTQKKNRKSFRKASGTGPPTPPHLSKHALASLFRLTYNAKLFIIHQRRQESMWPIKCRMLNETEIFLTFFCSLHSLHPISYTIIIIITLALCPCRALGSVLCNFHEKLSTIIFFLSSSSCQLESRSLYDTRKFIWMRTKGKRTSTNVDGWWNAVTHFRRHCRVS